MTNFTPLGVIATIKNLNKFLKDIGRMDKAIQGSAKSAKIAGDVFEKLGDGLNKLGKASGVTVSNFSKVDKVIHESAKSAKIASGDYKKLERSLRQSGKASGIAASNFIKADKAIQGSAKSAKIADSNFGKLERSLSQSSKASGIAASNFSKAGSALKTAGLVAGGVAVAGVAALTAATVSLGASGLKAAVDMEQSIADIRAVFSGAAPSVEDLNDVILALGVNPGLKVSATEAADAIGLLARNGLNWEEIAGGAAESSIQLANATGADFGAAADVATDVMALFNIEASEMSEAVNGITSVVNNSKFSFDDFRLALSQGGGVAATVGVGFEDFNTTIAAISPLFSGGSDAGTSFKTFLQRLIPTSNDAAATMRELGLFTGLTDKEFDKVAKNIEKTKVKISQLDPTSKKYEKNLKKLQVQLGNLEGQLVSGNNAFFDSEGNMKSMAEVSELLANSTSGLSEEQRLASLTTIFGSDAIRAASGLIEAGAVSVDGLRTEFEVLQETMSKTDAAESVKLRMDTLSGTMEVLSGISETISIRIGNALLPAFRILAETLLKFVDENQGSLIPFLDNLKLFLEDGIPKAIAFVSNAWTNILAPSIMLVSNFVSETLIPTFTRIISFFRDDASKEIGKFSDKWTKKLKPSIEGVKRTIENFKAFWDTNGPAILEVAESVFGTISSLVTTIAETVIPFLVDRFEKISEWWVTNGPTITELLEKFSKDFEFIGGVVENVWKEILLPTLTLIGDTLLGLGGILLSMLNGDWSQAWEGIKDLAVDAAMQIIDIVVGLGETIAQAMGGSFEGESGIKSVWASNWENLKEILRLVFTGSNGIIPTWSSNLNNLKVILDKVIEKISTVWTGNWENFKNILGLVFTGPNGIIPTWSSNWENFKIILRDVFTGSNGLIPVWTSNLDNMFIILKEVFSNILAAITDSDWFKAAKDVVQNLIEGATSLTQDLLDLFTSTIDSILSFFDIDWFQVGVTVIQGILDGVNSIISSVRATFSGLVSDVSSSLTDFDWRSLGDQIVSAIVEGINAKKGQIIDALAGAASDGIDSIKALLDIGGDNTSNRNPGVLMAESIALGFSSKQGDITMAMIDVTSSSIEATQLLIANTTPSIGEDFVNGLVAGLDAASPEFNDAVFSLAGQLGAIGGGLARQFKLRVIKPMQEQAQEARSVAEGFFEGLKNRLGIEDLNMEDLLNQSGRFGDLRLEILTSGDDEAIRLLTGFTDRLNEANGLTANIREENERLLEIEQKRADIDFLRQQLDLLELAGQSGVGNLLDGFQFGLNADVGQMLDLTSEIFQAMIGEAENTLGIESPSKVFANIGKQTMEGLATGIQSLIGLPAQITNKAVQMMIPSASPQIDAPLQSTNTQNVSIKQQFSNGLDLAAGEMLLNRALGVNF